MGMDKVTLRGALWVLFAVYGVVRANSAPIEPTAETTHETSTTLAATAESTLSHEMSTTLAATPQPSPAPTTDEWTWYETTTVSDNLLCDTDSWNVMKGDWNHDPEDCSLQNTDSGAGNIVWFGSADGLTPDSNYDDDTFELTATLEIAPGGNAGLMFRTGKLTINDEGPTYGDTYYVNLFPGNNMTIFSTVYDGYWDAERVKHVKRVELEYNTLITLSILGSGDVYTVYVDGVKSWTYTRTEFSSGSIGLRTYTSSISGLVTYYSLTYTTLTSMWTTESSTEPPTTTAAPIEAPFAEPTAGPSNDPTKAPTTGAPSADPSAAPTTGAPSADPSAAPTTGAPSADPSAAPTTGAPSADPSAAPTPAPTTAPTISGHKVVQGRTSWNGWGSAPDSYCQEDGKNQAEYHSSQHDYNIGVGCCSLDGTSGSRPDCKSPATYQEAVDLCSSRGRRLCTEQEMLIGKSNGKGITEGKGCQFDKAYQWVSDECVTSNAAAPMTNDYASIAETRSFDDYIPMVVGAAFGALMIAVVVVSVVVIRRRRKESEQVLEGRHGAVVSTSMGSDGAETVDAVIEMQ